MRNHLLLVTVCMVMIGVSVSRKILVREHQLTQSPQQCMLQSCHTQLEICSEEPLCVKMMYECNSQVQKNRGHSLALQNYETCLTKNVKLAGVWQCLGSNCLQSFEKLQKQIRTPLQDSKVMIIKVLNKHNDQKLNECIEKNCERLLKKCIEDNACINQLNKCAKQENPSAGSSISSGPSQFYKCVKPDARASELSQCTRHHCLTQNSAPK